MGLDSRSYDEKRDFVRVTIDYELGLQADSDGHSFIAKGKNLSAGGVLFHTDEPLQLGDQLKMHVEARQALLSVLDATIKVVRVEAAGDGHTWAVGGAITEMHAG